MLSNAESSFAVGDVQSALKHLNEFLRTCDPTATSESATKELYNAKLLRGRIYLTLAQMRNEDKAEERSRYRLDDIDKVTLCEMSINDATDAISLLPHDCHEAHSVRCQAAACGVPSRLRGFCIQALCLNPEDELLQALLRETRSADGRADKEGSQHRRQTAIPSSGSASKPEGSGQEVPVECEGATQAVEGSKTEVEQQEAEEEEDEDTAEADCSLCMRLLLEPITTPCGHTFCRGCLCRALDYADTSRNPQAFLSKGRQCPLCRSPLHLDAFTHPVTLIVERFIENHYPKQLQKRRIGEKAEAATAPPASQPSVVERQASTGGEGDSNAPEGAADSSSTEQKPPSAEGRTASSFAVVPAPAPPTPAPVQSVFPVFGVCDVLPGHHYEFLVFEPRYRLLIRRVMQGSRVLAIALESTIIEAQRRLAAGNGSATAPGGYPPVLVSCRILDTATDGMGRIALYVRALQRYTIERVWEEDAYYVTSCLPYNDQPPTDAAPGSAPASVTNTNHGGSVTQTSGTGRTAEETKAWYKENIRKLREICVRYYRPSNATEAAKIPDENWDPELASFWFARHFLTDSAVQWWCLRIRSTTERYNKILRAAGIQTA